MVVEVAAAGEDFVVEKDWPVVVSSISLGFFDFASRRGRDAPLRITVFQFAQRR